MKNVTGFRRETGTMKSLIIGSLMLLVSISLIAKQCEISVSTIAESSAGCNDGAIVVKTKPEDQCVEVTVNPGDYEFEVTTPAVLRPEGTSGFSAGDYFVKVKLEKKKKVVVKKCVEIPVAEYSVKVSSEDAHCSCDGSFKTKFKNLDCADVTVTYEATDSLGNIIGMTGDYIDLCPGVYNWTVQANSKSPACDKKVVFQDSGTVTIMGIGQLPMPALSPAAQAVAAGTAFTLTASTTVTTPVTYVLSTPGRGDISQTSNVFVLDNASAITDDGNYTVTIISEGCTSAPSDPVPVTVSCLAFTLQPINGSQTPTGGTGSIEVAVTNGISPFSAIYQLNELPFVEVTTPKFTISNLESGSYTVYVIENIPSGCSGYVGPVIITNTPVPVAKPVLDPRNQHHSGVAIKNSRPSDPLLPIAAVAATGGQLAALGLTNSSSKTICGGSTTSFVLTVTNYGSAAATNLVLTDVFNSCVSVLSATSSQWSVTKKSNGITAQLASLAQGASASVNVTVRVNCPLGSAPQGVATVTSTGTNPVTATATMKVVCCQDLCCKKKKKRCR